MRSGFIAVVGLLLALGGCYNPAIGEGDFVCGPGGECPSGFSCKGGRCYKGTPGAAGDGGADAPAGTGDGGGDGGCIGPLPCSPATTPPGGQCDPVCQSGCGCNQRCTNPGDGNACVAAPAAALALYDTCNPSGDTCRAGAVCLPEFQDRCGAHCYRFCRIDSDCPARSRCKGEAHDEKGMLLYKICSPPLEDCDPAGLNPRCGAGNSADRRWPDFACYMLSVGNPDERVCECAGTLAVGAECTQEYSCVPGSECIPLAGDKARCRRLCTVAGVTLNPTACDLGQRCVALPGSQRLGFCAAAL